MLEERNLGETGLSFIKGRLLEGSFLSRALLEVFDDSWRVFAPMPSSISESILYKFENGGIVDYRQVLDWLISYLANKAENVSLLVEDSWANLDDLAVSKNSGHLFSFSNSVIYGCNFNRSSVDETKNILKMPSSFQYCGCAIDGRLPQIVQSPCELSSDILSQVQCIFVGAYDREGIVVVERK